MKKIFSTILIVLISLLLGSTIYLSTIGIKTNKFNRPKELTELVRDVTRWRYGIKAHLESSLEALNLWNEDNPPQLKEKPPKRINIGPGIL